MSTNTLEKLAAEGKLLESSEALRCFLHHGVLVLDGARRVTALDARAGAILGLPTGATPADATAALPSGLASLAAESLAGRENATHAFSFTNRQNRKIAVRVQAFGLGGNTLPAMVVLILNDVSEARRFEYHIQQLDRLANIGTLSASMAHEIKNALVAGRTFVELLLERHQDADLVDVVRREMGRIDAILSRMLKFAGSGSRETRVLRLHEVIEHALRLVQPHLEAKGIALEQTLAATADRVEGNANELQQAFVNLFLNALDAMGPGGRLCVATASGGCDLAPQDWVEGNGPPPIQVRVKDSGPGVGPDQLPHLFEPFFTTKSEGTGLGLAITKRIVVEHGGRIGVESLPGQGTTFTLCLPVRPETASAR